MDVELGQRLGAVQVGDHADLAAVVGQAVVRRMAAALFSNTAASHRAVDQQALAGFPVGAVAGVDAAPVQEQAVAAGQADVPAR